MKLKDLKPNECIVINSRKEAKELRKLLNKYNVRNYIDATVFNIDNVSGYKGISFYNDLNNIWFCYTSANFEKEYIVKDFLPKKSKFKKDVNQELARLDNLTNDLLIRLSKFELDNVLSGFESVIPELNSVTYNNKPYKVTINEKGSYELTPETLKAITEPVISSELEVGKWYIDDDMPLRIVYVEKAHGDLGDNESIEGYGFDGVGKWNIYNPSRVLAGSDYMRLATHEEVETALIEEAKRRGFKDGVRFKSAASGDEFTFNGKPKLCEKNSLVSFLGCIFINGKWAEIIEEPKQEIDFKDCGQLLVGLEGEYVISLSDVNDETFFGALIVSKHDIENVFKVIRSEFKKSEFKLKND